MVAAPSHLTSRRTRRLALLLLHLTFSGRIIILGVAAAETGVDVNVKAEDVPLVKEQAGLSTLVASSGGEAAAVLLNVTETDFKSRVVGGAAEASFVVLNTNNNTNNNNNNGTATTTIMGPVCDPGFFLLRTEEEPTAQQPPLLLCSLCPPGFYCPGNSSRSNNNTNGKAVALPCPGGTANPDAGGVSLAAACTPCAPGTYYYNEGGAKECLTCPAGTYCNASGARAATPCPPHTASSAGSASLGECVCLPGYLCTYTRTVRMGLRFIFMSNSSSSSAAQQQQVLAALSSPTQSLGPEALAAVQALQTSLLAGLGLLQQAEPAAYGGSTDIGVAAVFEGFSAWVA
jgi:hypothetical protein